MYKSQKIALNPNNKQRSWFAQQAGYARFAYNHALADFKAELRFDGKIVEVTVSRTAHRWFVSIIVDIGTSEQVERSTSPIISIDVGINTLATLDTGKKYNNPRPSTLPT